MTYFKYTGLTLEALREQMRPQAINQVKGRLILEKIAALESLTPSEEMIEEEYTRMSTAYNVPLEQVKASIASEAIAEDMKVKMALDFVKEKAVIKKAKKAIKKAFQNQIEGKGFSLVEVVSTCSSGWKMTPAKANKWMEENMFPAYPLGDLRDRDANI